MFTPTHPNPSHHQVPILVIPNRPIVNRTPQKLRPLHLLLHQQDAFSFSFYFISNFYADYKNVTFLSTLKDLVTI